MIFSRYRRIVFFFARVVLNVIFWDLILPRLGLAGLARRTRSNRYHQLAARFRALAIQLGGVLIKVGQFLSARLDVLPEEVTSELAGLQDEVPPEDFAAIRHLAEAEFSQPLEAMFAEFETTPLAAASLGQAHRARLKSTEAPSVPGDTAQRPANVVVKVQRPNIENLITTDLAALRTVGNWLKRYPPIRRRADVPALLAEFTRILYEEIDYLAEGRNAETFAAHFKDRAQVRIPRVIWTHTTRRVLTLEDVSAIKLTDYAAITAAGIDRAEVARLLFDVYLKQIFEDGFFHADPHPGNLFVSPLTRSTDSNDAGRPAWQLTFIDFGMVGRVPPNLRAGLREVIIAIGTQDSARLVRSYQKLGMLLPSADLELLERAEAKIFERFWGKTMTELRQLGLQQVQEFANEFRELLYSMPFQVPEDLILLGRTFGILSGMCTGLDADFNFWTGLVPYAQKLVAEEATSGWEFWLNELGDLARVLLSLPKRMEATLSKLEHGQMAVRVPQLTEEVLRLELAMRRMVGGTIFAALLLGGVQLYVATQRGLGSVLLVGAAVVLLWVILAGRR